EGSMSGGRLVFRGDYNRLRERVEPGAVLARVVAVEVPGRKRGAERVVALEPDVLSLFYRCTSFLCAIARPLLPAPASPPAPTGPLGCAARGLFAACERVASLFLPQRRR